MADDDNTQQDAAPESGAAEQEQQQPKPVEVPAEIRNALKKANKEAETLRLRLKEFEDRDKTEQERATEARQAAERERDEARSHALRLEVAFAKGLTPAQAKRLVGSSREELEADADDILENFPAKPNPRPTGSADLGPRTTPPSSDPRINDLQQIERDLATSRRRT